MNTKEVLKHAEPEIRQLCFATRDCQTPTTNSEISIRFRIVSPHATHFSTPAQNQHFDLKL
jgi:hypothetical protein